MGPPRALSLRLAAGAAVLAVLFMQPAAATRTPSVWNCSTIKQVVLTENITTVPHGEGVTWTRRNCTAITYGALGNKVHVGPIVVNVADAASRAGGKIRGLPAIATTTMGLAPLSSMATAASFGNSYTPFAGINGGYFWRTDIKGFWFDDVCFGKTRADADRNASATDPNAGRGDSLTIINGTYASSNCDKAGNSKPVAMVLDYPPKIVQLERGGRLPSTVSNAIGAGPNLVSYNASTGQSYTDITGDNVNIVGHTSNTALALKQDGNVTHTMLVTFDGIDGCVEHNPMCGISAPQFAAFLIDYLGARTAMEMDQGGSTTMWVRGQANHGIVSNPGLGERNVFNGVFVGM